MKNNYSPQKLLQHMNYPKYPVMVDFDLTNVCNNKCPRCIGAKNRDKITMSLSDVEFIIGQLKGLGIKSIVFSGGGEPTCYKNLPKILEYTKKSGFSVAVNSNGYKINEKTIEAIVKNCSWIRISMDGIDESSYKRVHGIEGFSDVLTNISKIVRKKVISKSNIEIGVTYLVDDETIKDAYLATKVAKNLGVNFIRLRPFFGLNGNKYIKDLEECLELKTDKFDVSFPEYRVYQKDKREYEECLSQYFQCSITPDMKVHPCCLLKEEGKYVIGNLKEKTFKHIWDNRNYSIDLKGCPFPCTQESNNEFLWNIKQMKEVNFI